MEPFGPFTGLPTLSSTHLRIGNDRKTGSQGPICSMANIQSLRPRDRLWLKLRQRIRNHSKLGALPRPPLMPNPIPAIRCPYCVEGSHFKIMSAIAGGDWHKCEQCGHVVFQNDPSFQCACPKCADLNHPNP